MGPLHPLPSMMTTQDNPPAPAVRRHPLGKPATGRANGAATLGPARLARRLLRIWERASAFWLARRLAVLEAELRALDARLDDTKGESLQRDLTAWESCSMERAVLCVRLRHCRSMR